MDHLASLEQQAIEFAKRGDFGPDARNVNEQLTTLSPSNQGAWTRLARCCLELGLLDDATAALDRALQLNPQNTIARNLQGEVTRRRAPSYGSPAPKRTTRARSTSPRRAAAERVPTGGFGRAEFTVDHVRHPASEVNSDASVVERMREQIRLDAVAGSVQ